MKKGNDASLARMERGKLGIGIDQGEIHYPALIIIILVIIVITVVVVVYRIHFTAIHPCCLSDYRRLISSLFFLRTAKEKAGAKAQRSEQRPGKDNLTPESEPSYSNKVCRRGQYATPLEHLPITFIEPDP